jgi:hypothetical protein
MSLSSLASVTDLLLALLALLLTRFPFSSMQVDSEKTDRIRVAFGLRFHNWRVRIIKDCGFDVLCIVVEDWAMSYGAVVGAEVTNTVLFW